MKEVKPYQVIVAILLLLAVLYGAVVLYDHYYYPNYYRIKLGMTKAEIDSIVFSNSDDYPDGAGGFTTYYFTSDPGTIVVDFDRNSKAMRKSWVNK